MGAIPLRCHHGGSAVCLIAADADLDRAVSEIVRQRFENAGQAPISASTVLVEASVASEFVERLRVAMERITTGDPLLPETRMGPLTEPCRARQAAGIIETLVSAGAKLVHGGTCEGSAMSPALLAEADLRHPSLWTRDGYRELLSPIILSTPIEGTIEDATEWLDRRSHLVACLFTRDVERAARLASKLPVFNVHVNGIPTWRDGVIFTSDSSSRLGRRQVDVRVREVSILQDVVFHPF
jgi:benzaldehyde dehydrogenase (NAD)